MRLGLQAYAVELLAKCQPDVLAIPGVGEDADSDGDDAHIECVLYVFFEPSKRRFHVDMNVESMHGAWP